MRGSDLTRRTPQTIASLGALIAAAAVLGMLGVAATILLPRGWWLGLTDRAFKPPPSVTFEALPAGAEASAPTPGFGLGEEAWRLYYLWVPRLGLYAPVVPVAETAVEAGGRTLWRAEVPNAFAVGWVQTSAPVGSSGNTVLVGHNNEFGDVFKDMWYLAVGDEIVVQTDHGDRRFVVSDVAYFRENGLSLEERLANAAWIAPTADERLTLVTCWPYYTNTHRLVVVALPEGA